MSISTTPWAGGLRRSSLRAEMEQAGGSLKGLTVLAPQNDPFRVDTPARHRDGAWLGVQFEKVRATVNHLRGFHYALTSINVCLPDGKPYINNDSCWSWLQDAAKAARWLRYIPFDQLDDQRNAAPVNRFNPEPSPMAMLSCGLDVALPDADDLEPYVYAAGFEGRQPYKLVMFGEKSSLEQVLGPVAERFHADLYLASGELSDTQIHIMAKTATEDGRPMALFTFCDADPAGWQMPISIGRKLQAFKTEFYPDLQFELHRVGLTPDQVREYGLPSTPLKATEKRADRWQREMGTAQTEIDAWMTLAGDALRQEAEKALGAYFDSTLDARVRDAKYRWQDKAQEMVNQQMDQDKLDALRVRAAEQLAAMQAEIDALNAAMQFSADDFELPPPVVPDPVVTGPYPLPLLDSSWSFSDQCTALINDKAYRGGDIG